MVRLEGSGKNIVYWKTQLPIDYIDTSLTINNWETVSSDLSGGKPARLLFIVIVQTNNGGTAENIELEVTINGTVYTFTQANAASGTRYYCNMTYDLSAGDFTPNVVSTDATVGDAYNFHDRTISFDATSVGLIRVRQTTSVDATSAQIEVNIVWEKLVGV